MTRMRQRITLRLVQSLKADGCDRLIWDDDVSGFGIRISPAGHVGYVLQYRVDGRQRRYNIGRHGSPWTPETARQEAKRLLGSLADGADPPARPADRSSWDRGGSRARVAAKEPRTA